MGILKRLGQSLAARSNPLNNPAVPLGGPGFWTWLFAGEVTESGEQINDLTALQLITVYTCVRIISKSVASLPLRLYRRLPKGREEAVDAPIHYLLRYAPNEYMTAYTFWESLSGSLALSGNGYAEIARNKMNQVCGLYPLNPHKTEPFRGEDGKIRYRTSVGMSLGNWRFIEPANMLHIPLFSFDGLKGLSPIEHAKQTIGVAKATEKYGARFFGNGSRPGGILKPSQGYRPDEKSLSTLRESWQSMQGGVNQGKVAILPGEWEWQQITLSPEDSQFLKTRQYTRTEIAALFDISPHRLGDTSRMSSSNHEQASLQFVTETLRPYLTQIEQEVERKLMPQIGRAAGQYFAEFDVRERLRGDFETTMKGYALGRQWGLLTPDSVLEEMGENPIGGAFGASYLVPSNMVAVDSTGKPIWYPNTEVVPGSQPKAKKQQIQKPPSPSSLPEQQKAEENKSLEINTDLIPAFAGIFRDACGRFLNRSKRDQDTFDSIFGPFFVAITKAYPGLGIRNYSQQIFERSSIWAAGDVDAIALREFDALLKGVGLRHAAPFVLFIARHGESEDDISNKSSGPNDTPLTATGELQAQYLAAKVALQLPQLAAICGPNVRRHMQTMEYISKATGVQFSTDDDLDPWRIGELEGADRDELKPYKQDPDSVPPGGESKNDAIKRSNKAIQKYLGKAEKKGPILLVVSHKNVRWFCETVLESDVAYTLKTGGLIGTDGDEAKEII